MSNNVEKIFIRTVLKQELSTYALIVPMLAVFALNIFTSCANHKKEFMIVAVIAGIIALICGVAIKYYYMYPMLESIKKLKQNIIDISLFEKAKFNAYKLPMIDAIVIFLRWFFAGVFIGASQYIMKFATISEIIAEFILISFIAILSFPLYYLISEGECLNFININEIRKVKIINTLVLGIVQKIIMIILSIMTCSMGLLILIIYLGMIKYLDLANAKASIVLLLINTLVMSGMLIVSLTNNMKKSFKKIEDTTQDVIEGDFTRRIDLEQRDEIGQVVMAFDTVLDYSAGIIQKVKNSSSSVTLSSQQLAKATEESGATMEEVTSSVSSISKDMTDNLSFIQQASTNVKEVYNSTEMVANSCQSVAEESKRVKQDAIAGGESVKQVLISVNEVAESSKETALVISRLSELSKRIGDIIEIITGISNQTNLLSLNAAIEAARAGEAGKGFAVVAEEVRKLASETNEAAKDITVLINEVQNNTQNAVDKITIGGQKVSEGVKRATDTNEYIQGIVRAIDNVANQIDKISTLASNQIESSKKMNESMDNILKITQSTAEASHQVSAGIEEQTGTLQGIGLVATNLEKMAGELDNTVKKFKVN